jgi:nitrogen fixation NifU-like protein
VTALSPLTESLFRHLPGAGALAPGPGVSTGEAGSRPHGAQVRFHLQVRNGVVIDARFQAFGCPHTLAACAFVVGQLPGRPVAQGLGSSPQEWARELEVPTEKLGRLLLVEDAVIAALRAARMPLE